MTENSHVLKEPRTLRRLMSDKTIADRTKDIIVEQLGVNADQIKPEAKFIEDLGADSLDIVELVMGLEEEFGTDIREVEIQNHISKTKEQDFILYGSSTLRLWKDAKTDLAVSHLSNLAFGGATLAACQAFAEKLLTTKITNGKIIIYAGDNDLGSGLTVHEVVRDYKNFLSTVKEILPEFEVFIISIKPCPFRRHLRKEIEEVNLCLKKYITNKENWNFIDIHSSMLEAYGADKNTFYSDDPLHMNEVGYALLSKKIRMAINN